MMRRVLWVSALAGLVLTTAGAADVKNNWQKHCAQCHGFDGQGDTKMGKKLGVKDYADPRVQATLKDSDMFKAIQQGVKERGKERMRAYGNQLSDEEIKALVAYIRSFKK